MSDSQKSKQKLMPIHFNTADYAYLKGYQAALTRKIGVKLGLANMIIFELKQKNLDNGARERR